MGVLVRCAFIYQLIFLSAMEQLQNIENVQELKTEKFSFVLSDLAAHGLHLYQYDQA